jgi:hypothetical protein
VHDQVQAALQVVEHRDFFRQHQQRVGRAEPVGLVVARQTRLDVADALEAEIADQPAAEAGQALDARHAVAAAQALDLGQRIGEPAPLDDFVVLADLELVAAQRVHAPARQADDRIAAPVLAALDRLEQVGVGAVGQLQVHRQRRVEVGQHLARHRNAVVALGGEAFEVGLGEDHGRKGRRLGTGDLIGARGRPQARPGSRPRPLPAANGATGVCRGLAPG